MVSKIFASSIVYLMEFAIRIISTAGSTLVKPCQNILPRLSPHFEMALAKDYFLGGGTHLPKWARGYDAEIKKEKIYEIITNDAAIGELNKLKSVPARERHKYIKVEKLYNMIWLISMTDKKIMDITSYL